MKTLIAALALAMSFSFTAIAHKDEKEVLAKAETTVKEEVTKEGDHITKEKTDVEYSTDSSVNPSEKHHFERTTVEQKNN